MQNQQAIYNITRKYLGLDVDPAPPVGEAGSACAHLCRVLGVNPLQEWVDPNPPQRTQPTPDQAKRAPTLLPPIEGKMERPLNPTRS